MKKNIKEMVASCTICQQNKYDTLSLPIPQKVWYDIFVDFITGFPPCRGKTVIFVVVDMFSKYPHFLSLSHLYIAFSVAQVFIEHVFKLHGMPTSIVSDKDSIFISSFWR